MRTPRAHPTSAEKLEIRLEALSFYSGGAMKCALCPEARVLALDLDHIAGGGTALRKKSTNRVFSRYRTMIREADHTKYRVLCRNCNRIEDQKLRRVGIYDCDPKWDKLIAWIKSGMPKPTFKPPIYNHVRTDMKWCCDCDQWLLRKDNFYNSCHGYCKKCFAIRQKWRPRKLRLKALHLYSSGTLACVKCKHERLSALDIDHIAGGGSNFYRPGGTCQGTDVGSLARYRYYLKAADPTKYRVLCQNCNWIEHIAGTF